MSSIKIPELNLYRGKRTERHAHYQTIQKEGLNLLAKSKNKQLLHELKTQLYLDTYKSNLNHFVSPSKYREKAQKYLRDCKHSDTLLLKTLTFPKPRYQCPNCFFRQTELNRCSCDTDARINLLKRVQSTEGRVKQERRSDKYQIERFQRIAINNQPLQSKSEEINLQSQPLLKQQIYAKEPISNEGSSSAIVRDISNISFHRQCSKSNDKQYQLPHRQSHNIQFIQDLNRHHNQLDNINLSLEDSSSLSVDFSGLLEAKRQYVSKSKDILQSLDKILLQTKNQ